MNCLKSLFCVWIENTLFLCGRNQNLYTTIISSNLLPCDRIGVSFMEVVFPGKWGFWPLAACWPLHGCLLPCPSPAPGRHLCVPSFCHSVLPLITKLSYKVFWACTSVSPLTSWARTTLQLFPVTFRFCAFCLCSTQFLTSLEISVYLLRLVEILGDQKLQGTVYSREMGKTVTVQDSPSWVFRH